MWNINWHVYKFWTEVSLLHALLDTTYLIVEGELDVSTWDTILKDIELPTKVWLICIYRVSHNCPVIVASFASESFPEKEQLKSNKWLLFIKSKNPFIYISVKKELPRKIFSKFITNIVYKDYQSKAFKSFWCYF